MSDLFEYSTLKARREALEATVPSISRLRRVALETLDRLGSATPLEAAEAAGLARWSIQPRFSELRAMGLVESTGMRRLNPSGRGAAVLCLSPRGQAALRQGVEK